MFLDYSNFLLLATIYALSLYLFIYLQNDHLNTTCSDSFFLLSNGNKKVGHLHGISFGYYGQDFWFGKKGKENGVVKYFRVKSFY